MRQNLRPKVGFAFSGAASRSTFYIGFLEVLQEQAIPIDFICASSGASLAAAAFSCGTLGEFKKQALLLDYKKLKELIAAVPGKGGVFSLDKVEEEMQKYTKGQRFEEVRPIMSFVAADIERGELVSLCTGDIAKAAKISCTVPGLFEPIRWGNRTLVDGGLLDHMPLIGLKQFPVDVSIVINMLGTKHIFTEKQLIFKKVLNFFKGVLFIYEIEALIGKFLKNEDAGWDRQRGFFTTLGKSMDLAIELSKKHANDRLECDLMIIPEMPERKANIFTQFNPYHKLEKKTSELYYEIGRETALEYLPKIKALVGKKAEEAQKQAVRI